MHNLRACAEAFLELADEHGLTDDLEPSLRAALGEHPNEHGGIRKPLFPFTRKPRLLFRPPELVNAQLVERFGDPSDHERAFRRARWIDVTQPSVTAVRAVPDYVRWVMTWSLYHEGVVAKVIRSSTSALQRRGTQGIANLPLVRRYRDIVLNKGTALLLQDGQWRNLLRLTQFAMSVRKTSQGAPRPDDLYYYGHALRYAGELSVARTAQQGAEAGLAGRGWRRRDPERLAGAILELGMLDLFEGRFRDALGHAEDLKDYRGRYAIQRWAAWGHWLGGMAWIYLLDLERANEELSIAAGRFHKEIKHLNDVHIAQLLVVRVSLALGVAFDNHPSIDWADLTRRQRDDVRLVHADLALAEGHIQQAGELVEPILADPSNVLAALWAELVMAEVERVLRKGHTRFQSLRDEARKRGARWLELQAVAGLTRVDSISHATEWQTLASEMQLPSDLRRMEELQCRERPVLWSVT